MDLFYKMEGKDMCVENGSVVAAPYYQEVAEKVKSFAQSGHRVLLVGGWRTG
jgi:hypothetical protein